jgi:hypothetical protein
MAEGIDARTVKRVIALRKKGAGWPEILEKLDQPQSFIGKVRPLMKEIDPESVLPLGPGSPKYGKSKAKKSG